MTKATIICEYNCYERKPTLLHRAMVRLIGSMPCADPSSVWLSFPPDEHGFADMGTRIIGPIPSQQAEAVVRQLEAVLSSAGVEVTVEYTADD